MPNHLVLPQVGKLFWGDLDLLGWATVLWFIPLFVFSVYDFRTSGLILFSECLVVNLLAFSIFYLFDTPLVSNLQNI